MIVTIAKIDDFDKFLKTFSTKGAEKRRQHGCTGSSVFRDPEDSDRVWVFFDWKVEDYEGHPDLKCKRLATFICGELLLFG